MPVRGLTPLGAGERLLVLDFNCWWASEEFWGTKKVGKTEIMCLVDINLSAVNVAN